MPIDTDCKEARTVTPSLPLRISPQRKRVDDSHGLPLQRAGCNAYLLFLFILFDSHCLVAFSHSTISSHHAGQGATNGTISLPTADTHGPKRMQAAQATGDQCELPQLIGTGPYRIPRWYFNTNTRRCELFYYSGCCGNGNNFPTYEACQMICEVDPCVQTRDPGIGSMQLPRYHFNRDAKLCEPFTYFGSGGNRNNFATAVECRTRCPESPNPCAYGEPMRQGGGSNRFLPCGLGTMVTNACPVHFYCHVGSSVSTTVCCPRPASAPDRCQQPHRLGVGGETIPRWYFDQSNQECKPFRYKGLQGNENNFLLESDCENTCSANPCGTGQPLRASGQIVQCRLANGQAACPERHYCHIGIDHRSTVCCPSSGDLCRQEVKVGNGPASVAIPRWWHDSMTNFCKIFNYTGMGGNENNFVTQNDCKRSCKVFSNACPSGQPSLDSSGQPTLCKKRDECPVGHWCHIGAAMDTTMCCPGAVPNPCLSAPTAGSGSENVSRWSYDVRAHKCTPFSYTGIGGNENNFLSREECRRSCPELLNPCPIGEPVMERGPGGFLLPVFCNPNNPQGACPSNNWCHIGDANDTTVCCPRIPGPDLCSLPLAPGSGRAQVQRWYFNAQTLSCQPFYYTGIRGNENNFVSKEACESKCPVFHNPCLGGPVQDDGNGRPKACAVPTSQRSNPCKAGYYCHVGGGPETTVCCPSVGTACQLPLAVGVGSLSLARFYFNPSNRQCLPFQYRGSHGNDNNFLSEAACSTQCPVFINPCPDSIAHNGTRIGPPTQPTPCAQGATCPSGHWCHIGETAETTVCCKHALEHRALLSPCDMPVTAGSGSASLNRWYYDGTSRRCSLFKYKGFFGNPNNFVTKEECEQTCPSFVNACPVGEPSLVKNRPQQCGSRGSACPASYWCHVGDAAETTMCCPQATNPCEVPLTPGTGSSKLARWYFDHRARTCRQFQYRGLQGNPNNFLTKDDCEVACPVFQNPCPDGEPLTDPSGRAVACDPRSTNARNNSCPATHWCHAGADGDTVCCPGQQNACQLPVNPGQGNASLSRWYYDTTERQCKSFSYRGAKGNPNNFLSPDDCSTTCPVFMDPCPNAALTSGRKRQESIIYCSMTEPFVRRRLPMALGTNASIASCPSDYWCHVGADSKTTVCCPNAVDDPCQLPQSRGTGSLSLSRYFFDTTSKQCKQFSYSGLGGNQNNYLSLAQCEKQCPAFVNPCRRGEPVMIGNRPQQCSINRPCPISYWCHFGAMADTTLCCPAETNEPCHLPMDPGVGGSALTRWYFSTMNRQCMQFSYQGLRGNQNNFLTREECERTCRVNPCAAGEPATGRNGGPLQCALEVGCPAGHWCHYGESAHTTVCCPGALADVCELPQAPGTGAADLQRFYYNAVTRDCVPFVYRGAGGNQNNFLTLASCRRACPGTPNPCRTGEPPRDNSGRYQQCTSYASRSTCPEGYWCHSGAEPSTSVCCPGAENPCVLPVLQGIGNASAPRWHYNSATRQCAQFQYRGLSGNQNNFLSEQECARACPVILNPCPFGQPVTAGGGQPQYCTAGQHPSNCPSGSWCHYGADRDSTVCCPNAVSDRDVCALEPSKGSGTRSLTRWYFNPLARRCIMFTYTGIGGNQNNFLTREECTVRCPEFENPCAPPNTPLLGPDNRPIGCSFSVGCSPGFFCHLGYSPQTTVCCPGNLDSACSGMPMSEGRGDYALPRWYYDINTRTCRPFQYRGIQGNANNFQSQAECEQTCRVVRNPCPQPLPSPTPIYCSAVNPICPAGLWCHLGEDTDTTMCCAGAVDNPCILPLNPGAGTSQLTRFYYNVDSNRCIQFTYRGAQGNQNNFMSLQECEQQCNPFANPCPSGEPLMTQGTAPFNRPQTCNALSTTSSCPAGYWCHVGANLESTVCCPGASDPCVQPVATGVGNATLTRYYYDQSSRQCVQFTYSGTKGNQNNFPSMEACRMACREFRNPCIGQPAVTPSGQVVFCSATNKDSCPVNYWCHIGTNSETTMCCPGATNPCSVPLSPGTGSDNLPRYYYNADSRTCVSFVYNGLGGNQNNFLSLGECQGTCPVFVNPCLGGPPAVGRNSAPLQCNPVAAGTTAGASCPATYWCHVGASQRDTLCCPGAVDNACLLAKAVGRGSEKLPRWYFDTKLRVCQLFEYTGLGGNQNNFVSRAECQHQCRELEHPCQGEPEMDERGQPVVCNPLLPAQCGSGHFCHAAGQNGEGPNFCCPMTGDLCDAPKLDGEGDANWQRWYYSRTDRTCVQFSYRGRRGNQNNFASKEDCMRQCQPEINPCVAGDQPLRQGDGNVQCAPDRQSCPITHYCHVGDEQRSTVCCPRKGDPCQQPLYIGSGSAMLARWFYSAQEDECLSFTYSGRSGNENNFLTKHDCEQACPGFRDLCPHSKPLQWRNQPRECAVQTLCPDNYVCHVNTQHSKSICCLDPAHFCVLPRDPGPCSNFTTHYGYSRETGSCVPFKFGGCGGNENNFNSLERCTEVCCDKGF